MSTLSGAMCNIELLRMQKEIMGGDDPAIKA